MKIMIEREQKQTGLFLLCVSNMRNAVLKLRFLSAVTITAILFASCSSDDEVTTEVNDGRVVFTSGMNIATPKVGGAEGDRWNEKDSIGIYMRDNASKAIVSENIQYYAKSLMESGRNAIFEATDIDEMIYYPVNTPEKVDFLAYHPYQKSVSNYVYKVDVSSEKQRNQSAIDLMRAHNDNNTLGFDKTSPFTINLKFDHQLTKVFITVTVGSGIEANPDNMEVNIYGMNTTADFAIDKAELSNEGKPSKITAVWQPETSAFEAILLPVAELNNNHRIEFTTKNGETYKWNINNQLNPGNITSLEKGYSYTFDVLLLKGGVRIENAINKWSSLGYTVAGIAQ